MRLQAIFIISVSLLFTQILSAQGVDDRAKDKAENKANQRIDNRVDQGIDKGLDAIEGLFKKKDKKKKSSNTEESNAEAPASEEVPAIEDAPAANDVSKEEDFQVKSGSERSNPLAGMFKKAVWKDEYTFDIISNVTVTETKKNGKEDKQDFVWKMGNDVFSMDFEDEKDGQASIIMDAENQSFISLFVDEEEGPSGVAFAMNQDQLALAVDRGVEEDSNVNASFKKTGRTKEVAGYTCSEYTYTDEETEGVMWMTEEVDISMYSMVGLMTNGKSKHSKLPENYPSGYAMEMTTYNTKKKDSFHYLVTELTENANEVIDTTTYKVIDPMSMMGNGQ